MRSLLSLVPALIPAFIAGVFFPLSAPAQTVATVHSFATTDGASPRANLTATGNGTLFSTTYGGGSMSLGTVFAVTPFGAFKSLYSFNVEKGEYPTAALTFGPGSLLYGASNSGIPSAYGTLFTVTPDGSVVTTIHTFLAGANDGAYPVSAVTFDGSGNLYGTTQGGGPNSGNGTVYTLTAGGAFSVLHGFNFTDGSSPLAALTLGSDQNFYGTTSLGGTNNDGTVFQITPAGQFTSLYSFAGADGSQPAASLTQGAGLNFYGTTSLGGAFGQGALFKITSTGSFTPLYSFCSLSNCADGSQPFGSLALGSDGNFYGTTKLGGANNLGTIFEITPAGVFTTLYSFRGPEGANPVAGLTLASDGTFYGTASNGGANGAGSVFQFQPCLPGPGTCVAVSTVSSLNPSTYGDPVTLTATVTPTSGSGVPTGTVSFSDNGTSLGSAQLAGEKASVAAPLLNAGQHPITVSYGGDANFRAGSGDFLQVVNQAATNNTLASSVNPASVKQPVTLNATIQPNTGAGVATGTVVFRDGSTNIGSAPVVSGIATLSPSFSTAGMHSLTASYSGDANNLSSVGSLSETVNPATTTTVLQTSSGDVAPGQSVTFTATVTGAFGGLPTGTVTFFANASQIGSPVAVTNLQAAITTSFANPGAYSITASYSGDTNYLANSTATPLNQKVQLASTTMLTSSTNPSVYNQPVTFTATVPAVQGFATPTGKITFRNGSQILAVSTLVSGSASITPTALNAGSLSLTATYSGDTNYLGSVGSLTQVIGQASTTTMLTNSSGGQKVPVNQQITLTATLTAAFGGVETGTVTFMQNGSPIGSPVAVHSHQASLVTSFAAPGTYTLTAVYSGDTNYLTSTSTSLSQPVVAVSTTMLESSINPSVYHETVKFTATVPAVPGSPTPTGTISFKDGTTPLGVVTLSGGSAFVSTAALTAGVHSIIATYSGDSVYQGSSASLSQTVNQAGVTVGVTSSANPLIGTGQVTFTAKVGSAFGGSPSGTVTFAQNGTQIGSPVAVSGGTASISTTFANSGMYSITATYSGDTNFTGGSGSLTETVYVTVSTTTTLKASSTTPVVGTPVTFTATVKPAAGKIPDGEMVTFSDGSTVLGTGMTASGVATYITSSLAVGPHSITATYAGDSIYVTSTSTALALTVTKNATTTMLTANPNPSMVGQPVTFSATVTSVGPVPTGTVVFKNGNTAIGSGTLLDGIATLIFSKLPAGMNSITATYGGDSVSSGSVSNTVVQVVN